MRTASAATVVAIVAIAVYFATSWGLSAVQVLVSPSYGLEEVWRSQVVFQIGAFFHFGPFELVKLAAFLAAVKLATAVVCAVHVVERACGKLNSELLEGALLIVIALSALSCAPAVWSHNVDLLREYTMQLAMAGVGVALCMVERALSRPQEPAPVVVEEPYSPF